MLLRASLSSLRTVSRQFSRMSSTSSTAAAVPQPVQGRSFKLALVQLGGTSPDKSTNLQRARELALKAAKGKDGNDDVDLIVLPECFNSLYGTGQFSKPDLGITFSNDVAGIRPALC